MCLSSKTKDITNDSMCELNSTSGNILLTSDHKIFSSQGSYGILVRPTEVLLTDSTFGIIISSQSGETELTPGIWNKFQGRYKDKIFKFVVGDISHELSVVVDSANFNNTIFAKLSTLHRADLERGEWVELKKGRQTGLTFNSSQISKSCGLKDKEEDPSRLRYPIKDCFVYLNVSTDSESKSQVNILLIADKYPINVENDIGFSIPSPLSSSILLVLPSSSTKRQIVSMYSPVYDMQISAILNGSVDGREAKLSYFASGTSAVALSIPREDIISMLKPKLSIMISNIDIAMKREYNEKFLTNHYDFDNFIDVQISSGAAELRPNVKTEVHVKKGLCSYLIMRKFSRKSAVISIVRIVGGDFFIYVKKGSNQLASAENKDASTSSFENGIILLEPDASPTNEYEDYSVAVCAKTNTNTEIVSFEIVESPIYSVNAGQVLHRKVKKEEGVLVHFVAKDLKSFAINIDSEISQISAFSKVFEKDFNLQAYQDLIPSKTKDRSLGTSKSPGFPLQAKVEVPSLGIYHYTFLILSLSDDHVTVFIDDLKNTVQIDLKANEKLNEMMSKGTIRNYVLSNEDFLTGMTAKLTLNYGNLTILSSGKPIKDVNNRTGVKESKAVAQGLNAKVIEIDLEASSTSHDGIFKKSYLTLIATSEALFDIEWNTLGRKMKRFIPSKTEFIDSKDNKDVQMFYFQIGKNHGIKSLKVMIETWTSNSLNEKFQSEWMQNTKFYYLGSKLFGATDNELKASKVIADIKSKHDYKLPGLYLQHYLWEFNVMEGFFLVEIPDQLRTVSENHMSLELVVNDFYSIPATSYTTETISGSVIKKMVIVVPNKGKLWFDLEDCSGMLHIVTSRSLNDIESKVPTPHFKAVTEEFEKADVYYVLVKVKKEYLTMQKNITYIVRSEFMDTTKPAFLSSFFKGSNPDYEISPQRVVINKPPPFLTNISVILPEKPSSTLDEMYPDIINISITIIHLFIERTDQYEKEIRENPLLSKCSSQDSALIETLNTGRKFAQIDNLNPIIKNNQGKLDWKDYNSKHIATIDLSIEKNKTYHMYVEIWYSIRTESSITPIIFRFSSKQPLLLEMPGYNDSGQLPPQMNNIDDQEQSSLWSKSRKVIVGIVILVVVLIVVIGIRRCMVVAQKPDEFNIARQNVAVSGSSGENSSIGSIETIEYSSPQDTTDQNDIGKSGNTQLEVSAVSDGI